MARITKSEDLLSRNCVEQLRVAYGAETNPELLKELRGAEGLDARTLRRALAPSTDDDSRISLKSIARLAAILNLDPVEAIPPSAPSQIRNSGPIFRLRLGPYPSDILLGFAIYRLKFALRKFPKVLVDRGYGSARLLELAKPLHSPTSKMADDWLEVEMHPTRHFVIPDLKDETRKHMRIGSLTTRIALSQPSAEQPLMHWSRLRKTSIQARPTFCLARVIQGLDPMDPHGFGQHCGELTADLDQEFWGLASNGNVALECAPWRLHAKQGMDSDASRVRTPSLRSDRLKYSSSKSPSELRAYRMAVRACVLQLLASPHGRCLVESKTTFARNFAEVCRWALSGVSEDPRRSVKIRSSWLSTLAPEHSLEPAAKGSSRIQDGGNPHHVFRLAKLGALIPGSMMVGSSIQVEEFDEEESHELVDVIFSDRRSKMIYKCLADEAEKLDELAPKLASLSASPSPEGGFAPVVVSQADALRIRDELSETMGDHICADDAFELVLFSLLRTRWTRQTGRLYADTGDLALEYRELIGEFLLAAFRYAKEWKDNNADSALDRIRALVAWQPTLVAALDGLAPASGQDDEAGSERAAQMLSAIMNSTEITVPDPDESMSAGPWEAADTGPELRP